MAEFARKVRKIESRASLRQNAVDAAVRQKRRVAAYARVSTDSDEQLSSYEAQVDFYTRHIKSNPEWEFAGVYTDEGISGTNTKKREGFNRMVADALDGKIDLILTKSISRFARNTVDTLTTVRKLKEKNVEVYFEKENIYTLDAKGEVMITIMSSLAQEESRSISENVTWGIRKSMADGKFSLAYKHFLGYEKGEDGLPKIVEDEAKIVREIYRRFLEGETVRMIADYLTSQGIPTPMGKEKWSVSTVMSILTNEKYKGDALLQKTYTADFLTKKSKKNHGEVPQYYIKDSHPAIIEPATFDLVQQEVERRKPNRRQLHRSSPFTAKIICGECGGYYGRKVWHSNSKHRKYIWRCNQKYEAETTCSTPNLNEPAIEAAFVEAFNQMLGDKEQYIARFEEMLPLLADTTKLEVQMTEVQAKHDELMDNLRRYMEENTRQIQDQEEYNRRFSELDVKCKKAEEEIESIKKEILAQSGRKEQIRHCLDELRECGDILEDFDLGLWNSMVESITVCTDRKLVFLFRDGTEVAVQMPEKTKIG
ncbi:recombinase family protein [Mediterraneibacter agrestimuris]|uniref:recombinase family protein n=1 Tax=Mediterraneibacter agrestimuris TaxID=2941333 RepID=UPI002040F6F6|nr:recombinase family protein [Mediterraneibacter agrestimuris]